MYSPYEIAASEQDLRERLCDIWFTRADVFPQGGSLNMELRVAPDDVSVLNPEKVLIAKYASTFHVTLLTSQKIHRFMTIFAIVIDSGATIHMVNQKLSINTRASTATVTSAFGTATFDRMGDLSVALRSDIGTLVFLPQSQTRNGMRTSAGAARDDADIPESVHKQLLHVNRSSIIRTAEAIQIHGHQHWHPETDTVCNACEVGKQIHACRSRYAFYKPARSNLQSRTVLCSDTQFFCRESDKHLQLHIPA